MRYEVLCFCPPVTVEVRVKAGRAIESSAEGADVAPLDVPGLYDVALDAYAAGAASVAVRVAPGEAPCPSASRSTTTCASRTKRSATGSWRSRPGRLVVAVPSLILQRSRRFQSGGPTRPSRSLARLPLVAVSRLLVVALTALLASCAGEPPRADVTNLRLQREGSGYPTLTGVLVNNGSAPISSADVFVTLYDDENRPLEDVLIQVRNVSSGDSARFEQRLDLPAGAAKLKYVGVN